MIEMLIGALVAAVGIMVAEEVCEWVWGLCGKVADRFERD